MLHYLWKRLSGKTNEFYDYDQKDHFLRDFEVMKSHVKSITLI